MGINLGAFLGPIVAGYLAQRVNWHIGFAAAGVGMAFGVVQYVLGRHRLTTGIARLGQQPDVPTAATAAAERTAQSTAGLSQDEWKRIGAIVIFFMAAVLFWGAYEQAGIDAESFRRPLHPARTRRLRVPLLVVPVACSRSSSSCSRRSFGWMWLRLGRNEPSVPAKFAWGLLLMGLSFAILIPAGAMASSAGIRVSPWWLIVSYFISELGELCISPVGLSAVTKLAPLRIVGLMMGVWFLSNAFGNKLAGWAAGFFSSMPLNTLFGYVTLVLVIAAA